MDGGIIKVKELDPLWRISPARLLALHFPVQTPIFAKLDGVIMIYPLLYHHSTRVDNEFRNSPLLKGDIEIGKNIRSILRSCCKNALIQSFEKKAHLIQRLS